MDLQTGGRLMPKTDPLKADPRHRARKIIRELKKLYPDPITALHHRNPYELLVATILSAQCTDERVNMVTPTLFAKYQDAKAMSKAGVHDIEPIIMSTGFFRSKSKSLVGMAKALVDRHGGQVPRDLDSLTELPGVGRKTANVVLGSAFGLTTGVVVDTHVKRLAYRLGLTKSTNPKLIEQDLMAILPRKEWVVFSHLLIFHGRKVCIARKPKCDQCVLYDVCPKNGVKDPPRRE